MNSFFKKKIDKVKITPFSIYRGHHKVKYRGVEAIKAPFDYVIYQMILFEVKPDLIIEIGSKKGGSALYLADLLVLLGKGIVHTIDLTDEIDDTVKSHPKIHSFIDGWEKYDLKNARGFQKILIIEDSLHTYECTLGALNKFKDLVTPGSYFIIEDGIIDELKLNLDFYKGGPLKAIHEFLLENKDFSIDRRWCDMFGINATFNVNGYLKKNLI